MKLIVLMFTLVCAHAQTDAEVVAAVLIAEAGGEGTAGLVAVREVIQTRSAERRQSERAVVTARWQFSCLNGTTPASLVERARRHPRWNEALTLASAPSTSQSARGANHYHSRHIQPPAWAVGRAPDVRVGNHLFYHL